MKSKYLIFAFILVIVSLFLYFLSKNDNVINSEIPINTPKITYINANEDKIKVDLPKPGELVNKEFTLTGVARGMWYFEATFPVDVLDKDGNFLVKTYASAEGEWMTENFVPFKSEIKIPVNYTGNATLVLHRSNASDLSENDASISFPFIIK